jgi:DNA-directed RNA polymerase sigma subunit (sigma70/sigma32)
MFVMRIESLICGTARLLTAVLGDTWSERPARASCVRVLLRYLRLSRLQRKVLRRSFGIGAEPRYPSEIARETGLRPEEVRRMRQHALLLLSAAD